MIILFCILFECVLFEFCVYLGLDDAVGFYISFQYLGSRQDGYRFFGIYGNRSNDVVEDVLFIIEEKFVMVRFFFYIQEIKLLQKVNIINYESNYLFYYEYLYRYKKIMRDNLVYVCIYLVMES